ncbi:MAG: hypothetical protein IIA67_04260 [Planctomycetes bacterium]|nr:hypothetical protein [Planctomycetota bacterium]
MLCIVAAAAIAVWVYLHLNDEIRARIEARLAEHYSQFEVSVRSARLVEGEGYEIRGLSIRDPSQEGDQIELLYLDEVFIQCDGDIEEIISGKLNIRRIIVRRPSLRATRRADGLWNVAGLLPLPKFGDDQPLGPDSPEVRIEDGTIYLAELARTGANSLELREVNLTLTPRLADLSAAAESRGTTLAVEGTLSNEHLQRFDLSGWLDPVSKRWSIAGAVKKLRITPELHSAIPIDLAGPAEALRWLRGTGQMQFSADFDPARPVAYQYNITAQLSDGRYDDPRLPQPVTDIAARLRIDNSTLEIEDLTAKCGGAKLTQGHVLRHGHAAGSPMELSAQITGFQLDQRWLALAPERIRTSWHKLLPAGTIDAELKARFDGQRWIPNLKANLRNVSFSFYKFRYPLERASGWVELVDNRLTYKLSAWAGSQRVWINGDISNPGPRFTGWTTIEADDVQIDETLLAALPGKSSDVVRSLRPQGNLSVQARLWRNDSSAAKPQMHVRARLRDCSVRFEKFDYPISNIGGTIELKEGRWTFHNLSGQNDSGRITCKGEFTPPEEGSELRLYFTGANIPLDEELRAALNPTGRNLWKYLKLQGSVDLVADVIYQSAQGQSRQRRLSLKVRAEPRGTSTSIEPECFDYKMTLAEKDADDERLLVAIRRERVDGPAGRVRGVVTYRSGLFLDEIRPRPTQGDPPGRALAHQIDFFGVQVHHGRTRFRGDARCEVLADGSWRLRLERFSADRVRLDRDPRLVAALPEALRKAIAALKPTGQMNVRGALEFAKGGPNVPVTAGWDVTLDVHRGTLEPGIKLENIYGGVRLAGTYDGRAVRMTGELNVKSLTYNNFHLTRLRGPLLIDERQALLGDWRPKQAGRTPRHLRASFLGGVMTGDVAVALSDNPSFKLRATLSEGSLKTLAREHVRGNSKLSGKIDGSLQLTGTAAGVNSLDGKGHVSLRDADIYELPLMVSLLKIISVRPPDKTAFDTVNSDFTVKANHLYFKPIEFKGDAVSLYGSGEMDLDQNLNLTFRSTIGRGRIPLISPIIDSFTEQIVLIHVDGTLDDPKIRQEPLPNLKRVIDELEGNTKTPSRSLSVLSKTGRLLDPFGLFSK